MTKFKFLLSLLVSVGFLLFGFQNCQNAKYGMESKDGSGIGVIGQQGVDAPPTLDLVSAPRPLNNDKDPQIVTIGHDDSGTVVYTCTVDAAPIECLDGTVHLPGIVDGPHTVNVVASDPSGQFSEPIVVNFVTDNTPPTVVITSQPSPKTTNTSATLTFVGHDTGSGIAGYLCSLDHAVATVCDTPINYSSLSIGTHHFEVVAYDRVGNISIPDSADWTVGKANCQ